MKVAIVHNNQCTGVINRFRRPCPEKYSLRHVQRVADALQANGHGVQVLEADLTLLVELLRFLPPDGGSYVTSAKTAGYSFNSLVRRILDVAHQRYCGCRVPRDAEMGPRPDVLPADMPVVG